MRILDALPERESHEFDFTLTRDLFWTGYRSETDPPDGYSFASGTKFRYLGILIVEANGKEHRLNQYRALDGPNAGVYVNFENRNEIPYFE